MIKNSATYISKIILVAIFVILSFSQKELYGAKETGVERIRQCDLKTGEISNFEPMLSGLLENTKVGKEMDYDLSNPHCAIHFAGTYATIKVVIALINKACGTGSQIPRVLPSIAKDLVELGKAGMQAIKQGPKSPCALAYGGGLISLAQPFAAVEWLFLDAQAHYNNVSVCGSDWKGPDTTNFTMISNADKSYSKEVSICGKSSAETNKCGSYNIENAYNKENDIEAKKYREWFFGGKEFEDNPAEGPKCLDPLRGNKPQRYYLRGLGSNFMCEKYNPHYVGSSEKKQEYQKAYECCLERNQNYICLDKKNIGAFSAEHVFCKANSKCSFKNNIVVKFEAYKRDNGRLICAKSYSLCPFNFAVGGGSPYPDYFSDVDINKKPYTQAKLMNLKNKVLTDDQKEKKIGNCEGAESRDTYCELDKYRLGKLKNYCQYYRHCTAVSSRPYVADFDILNPYYSKACIDFIGDSQNGVQKVINPENGASYNGGLLFGHQTNFSAPIVQCFKETMRNIFTNTAGHSRCMDGSFGNSANECKDLSKQESYLKDGDFVYKKGNKVKPNSLFEFLQKRLKMIITAVLVISITFLGFKILVGKLDLANKKDILVYIVKIAFVVYFVNGTAWKDIFFDGIYNGSSEISRIFFKIKFSQDNPSGCNFGSQSNADGTAKPKPSTVNYPKGSEYLMVWDTLDCKIMQYLNYGPEFSTSTMFLLIIAAFFTGGIGLVIALSVFIMAICLIVAVIRAMHIFISSAIAIIIYIFVSPIIIPLVLFEKTKGIFDSWLTQLMSFTLSPIVLFAYLAIFINLSEDIMFGGANKFKDEKIDCSEYCLNPNGEKIPKDQCAKTQGASQIINPLDESVACLLNFNDFDKDAGFAFFGIALPSIGKLLESGKEEIRVLLILKSALFLFILAQFMDEIPSVIARLTCEVIDVKSTGYIEVMKKFTSTMRGIQKRGARLIKGAGLPNSKEKGEEKDDDGGGGGGDIMGGGKK